MIMALICAAAPILFGLNASHVECILIQPYETIGQLLPDNPGVPEYHFESASSRERMHPVVYPSECGNLIRKKGKTPLHQLKG